MTEGDFVMVHSRFGHDDRPASDGSYPRWIAVDILRVMDGVLVEHWVVLEREADAGSSPSGLPMFGDDFPRQAEHVS